jgi:hypothetical protein
MKEVISEVERGRSNAKRGESTQLEKRVQYVARHCLFMLPVYIVCHVFCSIYTLLPVFRGPITSQNLAASSVIVLLLKKT